MLLFSILRKKISKELMCTKLNLKIWEILCSKVLYKFKEISSEKSQNHKLLFLVQLVTQLCPTLWPHGLQHARLPCPLTIPGACSNPCPSSRWCHPTISPSVVPFSSCVQSFPASGSFPMSQFFISGGHITYLLYYIC